MDMSEAMVLRIDVFVPSPNTRMNSRRLPDHQYVSSDSFL
jgi:hypothetical protein